MEWVKWKIVENKEKKEKEMLCQTHILRDNLAPKAYKIYTTKTNYPESLITAVNRN